MHRRPADWRQDGDGGWGKSPGFGFRARSINEETILRPHSRLIPGKLDSSLSMQPQGAHMPKNLMLRGCSQTRPTFKALILNECCSAGQISQAYVGPRRGQDVHLEARQARNTIQAMRKQRENKTQWKRGSVFPVSVLAGVLLSTWHATIREAEDIKLKATLPLFTRRNSFFLYFTIFSSV